MLRKQEVMTPRARWFCQKPQVEKSTPCASRNSSPVQLETGRRDGDVEAATEVQPRELVHLQSLKNAAVNNNVNDNVNNNDDVNNDVNNNDMLAMATTVWSAEMASAMAVAV
ncbi:hypothetical protein EYF80_050200 [Liparis tanakae]|uniref:Uncharacterized protein n=1 Tax=Liparis tanakae TaxID=230148 RepID=A0A4Z2FFF7_9TELE|nr:hypothetical protein EYF80_050200 [Liparis tanakae]